MLLLALRFAVRLRLALALALLRTAVLLGLFFFFFCFFGCLVFVAPPLGRRDAQRDFELGLVVFIRSGEGVVEAAAEAARKDIALREGGAGDEGDPL